MIRRMFTGITRGTFPVVSVVREPALLRYAVDLGEYGAELLLHQAFSQTTAPVRMTANIHTEVRHDTRGCHTNAKLLLPVLRPTA